MTGQCTGNVSLTKPVRPIADDGAVDTIISESDRTNSGAPGISKNQQESGGLGFCHMGCDRIHQWWRQAIIGLETEFLETGSDLIHFLRFDAGLNDG